MKKLITLSAIFIAAFTTSNAQLQKGNVLVGGDLANFGLTLNHGTNFSMDLTPKAAWFIKDNLAVGAYVKLGVQTGNGTIFTYGVGPLGRYYITDPKVNVLKHGRWFLEGNLGIGGVNYSDDGSTNGLDLGFGPGYAYFITPNVGLETLLKYNGTFGFGDQGATSVLSLNVGFQIYLPGKATRDRVINQEK